MQQLTCDFASKATTEFKVILLRTENCVCATLLLRLAHPLTNSHYFEFDVCWTVHHFDDWSPQPGHYSSLTAPNIQPTASQERNDQCGNQHYSRELLMMGIVVPETCWAYKKCNKIISDTYLDFIFQLSHYFIHSFSHFQWIYLFTFFEHTWVGYFITCSLFHLCWSFMNTFCSLIIIISYLFRTFIHLSACSSILIVYSFSLPFN